jgi:hypothetical protein
MLILFGYRYQEESQVFPLSTIPQQSLAEPSLVNITPRSFKIGPLYHDLYV